MKLEGRVSGSQPLSVSWYKDNGEIFTSDIYDIFLKSNMAVMCIKNAKATESGIYMCTASNEAGSASFQVEVNITGRQFCLWHDLTFYFSILDVFPLCIILLIIFFLRYFVMNTVNIFH